MGLARRGTQRSSGDLWIPTPLTWLLLCLGYPWGHARHRAQVSVRLLAGRPLHS